MWYGRGRCEELITRPEESYQLWCVAVCDLETSWMRRPWPTGGCRAKNKQKTIFLNLGNLWHKMAAFHTPTETLYWSNRKLDGSQSRSGRFADEKSLVTLMGIEHRLLGCPVRIVISIQTMLSQLPLYNARLINYLLWLWRLWGKCISEFTV